MKRLAPLLALLLVIPLLPLAVPVYASASHPVLTTTNLTYSTSTGDGQATTTTGGWGESGGYSAILDSGDTSIEATVGSDSGYWMVGFGDTTGIGYTDIDFAVYMCGNSGCGHEYVFENGSLVATIDTGGSQPAIGDVLKVSFEGTEVKYYRNNSLRYTSTHTALTSNVRVRVAVNRPSGYTGSFDNLTLNSTDLDTPTFTPTNTNTPTNTPTATRTPTPTYVPATPIPWPGECLGTHESETLLAGSSDTKDNTYCFRVQRVLPYQGGFDANEYHYSFTNTEGGGNTDGNFTSDNCGPSCMSETHNELCDPAGDTGNCGTMSIEATIYDEYVEWSYYSGDTPTRTATVTNTPSGPTATPTPVDPSGCEYDGECLTATAAAGATGTIIALSWTATPSHTRTPTVTDTPADTPTITDTPTGTTTPLPTSTPPPPNGCGPNHTKIFYNPALPGQPTSWSVDNPGCVVVQGADGSATHAGSIHCNSPSGCTGWANGPFFRRGVFTTYYPYNFDCVVVTGTNDPLSGDCLTLQIVTDQTDLDIWWGPPQEDNPLATGTPSATAGPGTPTAIMPTGSPAPGGQQCGLTGQLPCYVTDLTPFPTVTCGQAGQPPCNVHLDSTPLPYPTAPPPGVVLTNSLGLTPIPGAEDEGGFNYLPEAYTNLGDTYTAGFSGQTYDIGCPFSVDGASARSNTPFTDAFSGIMQVFDVHLCLHYQYVSGITILGQTLPLAPLFLGMLVLVVIYIIIRR